MTGLFVCLSAAVLGVDYGWQPIAGGGIEYIIQIEPQMLDALTRGEDLSSALPPAARNIRRYRIVAGNAPLPHHGEPLPIDQGEEPAAEKKTVAAEALPVRYDRLEDSGGAAPAKLSMPLASPYPHDYEAVGIPLPHPALGPPPVIRQRPTSIHEEPDAATVAVEPIEREETDSRGESQTAAVQDARDASDLWTSGAKRPAGFSPLPKTKPSEGPKPAERRSSLPSKQVQPLAADKQPPGQGDEPLSPSDQQDSKNDEQPSEKPGSAALVGLFASLGGNVFLIWVATGQRNRYRSLLRRSHEAIAAASAGELPQAADDDSPRWEEVPDHESPVE
jgi:hypothetical protein